MKFCTKIDLMSWFISQLKLSRKRNQPCSVHRKSTYVTHAGPNHLLRDSISHRRYKHNLFRSPDNARAPFEYFYFGKPSARFNFLKVLIVKKNWCKLRWAIPQFFSSKNNKRHIFLRFWTQFGFIVCLRNALWCSGLFLVRSESCAKTPRIFQLTVQNFIFS